MKPFSEQTLAFLEQLRDNNNREWFTAHKSEYQEHVLEPSRSLAAELQQDMLDFDPYMNVDPKRIVSRIYRDTRFSNDKTPYKICSFLIYRRPIETWYDAPCWFFEIKPEQYSYGMGLFQGSSKSMALFRQMIDNDPDSFSSIISLINPKRMVLHSDAYKRTIANEHGPEIQPYYQSKNFYLMYEKKINRQKPDRLIFSTKLAGAIIDDFVSLKPLYDFLWQVKAKCL